MADPTLDDVAKFIKYRTRAGNLGTDDGSTREAAQARDLASRMIAEFPAIQATARRVTLAMSAASEPVPDAPQASRWDAAVNAVSSALVDRVVSAATSAAQTVARMDEIPRGKIKWTPQDCAEDQVCVVIRANRADVNRKSFRDVTAEGIAEILWMLSTGRA